MAIIYGPFPAGVNVGYLHFDTVSGGQFRYMGGNPQSLLNWLLVGGTLSEDPSTVGWTDRQDGALWFNRTSNTFKSWNGSVVGSVGGSGMTAGTPVVANPINNAGSFAQAHGLSRIPDLIISYYECLATEIGYSVGDRVYKQESDNSASNFGYFVEYDAVNCTILSMSSGHNLVSKTALTGASVTITNSKWKVVATPYLIG